MQMQEAMRYIKTKLMLQRGAEAPGLAPRCLRADKNLTVLKGDHVGRARLLKKSTMQFRHTPVGHKDDADFTERAQNARFRSPKVQAFVQSPFREMLK